MPFTAFRYRSFRRRMACAGFALFAVSVPAGAQDWNEESTFLADNPDVFDEFGRSVALSGDLAVIGGLRANGRQSASGAAYVYDRVQGEWDFDDRVMAIDGATDDFFGYATAISGFRIMVGAILNFTTQGRTGAVYVFRPGKLGWDQVDKFTALDSRPLDAFGSAIALAPDIAVIGAMLHGDGAYQTGAAYVFEADGDEWFQTAKLVADDRAAEDWFGNAVAMSGDRVLIGARRADAAGVNSGAAYVFEEDDKDGWVQVAKILPADAAEGDHFGVSVSLEGDTAVIGAYRDGPLGRRSGSAYVFRESEGTWVQIAKLIAGDGTSDDAFGRGVALSGNTVVVGAFHAAGAEPDTGAAYVFRELGDTWAQVAKLIHEEGASGDEFGFSADVEGETVLVGARFANLAASDGGAAHVYRAFSASCTREPEWACDGDVEGDGQVNPVDAGLIQANFCTGDGCTEEDLCQYDMDCDGQLNPVDVGIVQSLFGTCRLPRAVCP